MQPLCKIVATEVHSSYDLQSVQVNHLSRGLCVYEQLDDMLPTYFKQF